MDERNPQATEAQAHGGSQEPNRLIREKSPYLLQHAYNPVDWYAWGDEAFEASRREDKPIFLSIGYSTCHWCHVMERESFEDKEIAGLMNDTFVSIKVDREERPDIDHIYMTVCQLMTGGGGWPLNIIMTPDKRPFFAGTYFPRTTRFGRIGMDDLSRRVKDLWQNQREEVLRSAGKVMNALRQVPDDAPGDALGKDVLETAFRQLVERFDAKNGGFSQAPKFPTPHIMFFLLRYWKRTGSSKALEMVEKTLTAMRNGGMYDHVGFGFHRYSTDAYWMVPHFEKMLYDQALLTMAYTEAFQATGKPLFGQTAQEILEYVLRDMVAPEGGFYSAEDADSEGEEGKFYVWTLQEIREVLEPKEAEAVIAVYSVQPAGNFRDEATGDVTGTNILYRPGHLDAIARELGYSESSLSALLEVARLKLFAARERRVRPHRDDKILADWNGLMIAALAKAAQVFERHDYVLAARKAAEFVLLTMSDDQGRLLHRYRDGEVGITATADDYAFFIWGLLELYEATFDIRYLQSALSLNAQLIQLFWDDLAGGFYFTSSEGEELILRKKEVYDGATPSGNSVAALNLLRLARITADPDFEGRADRIGRAFSGNVRQLPSAFTMMLTALEYSIGQSHEIVIASENPDSEDTREMLSELRRPFVPNKVVLFRSPGTEGEMTALAPYTSGQKSIGGKATAYVCTNFSCEVPTTDPQEMLERLR
ncbi:MAG: thioredoxin domain-containing protein [Thermodesulfobacteriota bacterium]